MEKQDREKISEILTKIAVIHAPGIPLGFIKRKVSKIVNILEKNIDDHDGIITSEGIKNLKEELSKMRNKDKGEFSEATIEGIRTREDARQRKIFEKAEGCSEGKRLFSIAWDAPPEDHGALYADYLEHLTKCKECIATFKLTDANIQRLKNDADGYRRGAEALKRENR